MDQIRIGKFIAELRKEQSLTQESLGEKLGVTNKTVSRWENGHYMPDIETLMLLSKEFNVSINELLSGERLKSDEYKEKAEENLLLMLHDSSFSDKEKMDFYKKKWKKEHRFSTVCSIILYISAFIAGTVFERYDFLAILNIVWAVYCIVRYNRMMIYAEDRVYLRNKK